MSEILKKRDRELVDSLDVRKGETIVSYFRKFDSIPSFDFTFFIFCSCAFGKKSDTFEREKLEI